MPLSSPARVKPSELSQKRFTVRGAARGVSGALSGRSGPAPTNERARYFRRGPFRVSVPLLLALDLLAQPETGEHAVRGPGLAVAWRPVQAPFLNVPPPCFRNNLSHPKRIALAGGIAPESRTPLSFQTHHVDTNSSKLYAEDTHQPPPPSSLQCLPHPIGPSLRNFRPLY